VNQTNLYSYDSYGQSNDPQGYWVMNGLEQSQSYCQWALDGFRAMTNEEISNMSSRGSSALPIETEGRQAMKIGRWMMDHYRNLAKKSNKMTVAARLRKQGIPLWVTLLVLLGVKERT
jgi:hypothetical protein